MHSVRWSLPDRAPVRSEIGVRWVQISREYRQKPLEVWDWRNGRRLKKLPKAKAFIGATMSYRCADTPGDADFVLGRVGDRVALLSLVEDD